MALEGYRARVSPKAFTAACVFAAAVLLVALLSRPVENLVRDVLLSTISPFTDPGDDIVIVSITEETLEKLPYRAPVDRGFLAELIEHIDRAGPRAIGIDILFDTPTETAKDARLTTVLETTQSPVVMADAGVSDGLTEKQLSFLRAFAPSVKRGLAVLSRDPEDGVVRTFYPGREENGIWIPALSQALAAAGGLRPRAGGDALAYVRTAQWTPYPFPKYPAQSVKLLPAQWLSGKFVLIGTDLPAEDRHPTPFAAVDGIRAGSLPGVVIHAHALAQNITNTGITTLGVFWSAVAMLMSAAAVTWLAWRPLPVIVKPLILFAILAAMAIAAALLFGGFGLMIPVVWPAVLLTGLFSGVSFLAWQRDNSERQFIRQAFSHYVSPQVVDSIVEDPGSLQLGGERRIITCIFTDLAGFTELSESHPPERTAALLNAYLSRICELFTQSGATIDKIVGDSVMGFFGAPATQDDQAERAVTLALEIDRVAEGFRAQMAGEGLMIGVTRVGIHMGPAVVGNIGGNRFFDYTAIGDTVNIASRLEGANKYLGTRLCASAAVADAAPSQQLRPAAVLFLKGKTRGLEVAEPLQRGSPKAAYLAEYCAAYRLMAMSEPGAADAFRKLAELHPGDALVALHARRLSAGERGATVKLLEK
jgi:adenylate cyclase